MDTKNVSQINGDYYLAYRGAYFYLAHKIDVEHFERELKQIEADKVQSCTFWHGSVRIFDEEIPVREAWHRAVDYMVSKYPDVYFDSSGQFDTVPMVYYAKLNIALLSIGPTRLEAARDRVERLERELEVARAKLRELEK